MAGVATGHSASSGVRAQTPSLPSDLATSLASGNRLAQYSLGVGQGPSRGSGARSAGNSKSAETSSHPWPHVPL
jgi:hypothetical protein